MANIHLAGHRLSGAVGAWDASARARATVVVGARDDPGRRLDENAMKFAAVGSRDTD